MTLHKEHIVVAYKGDVVSMEWHDAMAIWRGITATKATCYWLWNPSKPLESIATSLLA